MNIDYINLCEGVNLDRLSINNMVYFGWYISIRMEKRDDNVNGKIVYKAFWGLIDEKKGVHDS